MFRKIVPLFVAALTGLLAGCSVTSSLELPIEEKNAVSPQKYLGAWECRIDGKTYTVDVRQSMEKDDGKNSVAIQINHSPVNVKDEISGEWAPMIGYFFKVGDKAFISATINVRQLIEEKKFCINSLFLIAPQFYTLLVTEKGKDFELQFISFAESKNSYSVGKPLNRKLIMRNNLVLNSSGELYDLLSKGEYTLDKTAFRLTPKK